MSHSSVAKCVYAERVGAARNTAFTGRRVGGLSLKVRSVLEMNEINHVRLEDLEDPCRNCQEGLRQCDADLDQFRVDLLIKSQR